MGGSNTTLYPFIQSFFYPIRMGIARDSRHKHRKTGGHRNIHQKKRKYEMGRPPAMTKLGPKRVRVVRCRGGNLKYRALRLDSGNYAWGSENCTKKVRILDVVYNASNNELVRTKTLVKNTIVQIDAQPFKQWYLKKYGVDLGKKVNKDKDKDKDKEKKKEGDKAGDKDKTAEHKSRHVLAKLDPAVEEQFQSVF